MKRRDWLGLMAVPFIGLSARAQQAWPRQPIKLIVPFPPGGGTDFVARLLAERLTAQTGWIIVVDNKPGAGGNIGLDAVAKAAPDGYTIGLGQTANLAINPSLYPKMSFDPAKDFAMIGTVSEQPVVIVANIKTPLKTLADIVAASKALPESVRVGLPGNGTVGHLAGELLARRAGIKLQNVPYKGASPAMNDLLAGHVELNLASAASIAGQVAAGKVRAIAVTSRRRLTNMPALAEVPTVAESGYPGFDAITWTGLVAPAGTPAAVVDRINAELQKVLRQGEVVSKLATEGSTPLGGDPRQFAELVQAEGQKWGALIREANIKLE